MPDLLLELYVEELPASYLDRAVEALPDQVKAKLQGLRVLPEGATVRATGTPRRIAVHAAGVLAEQRGTAEELLGPPVSAAFKDGKPTKAAEAFAAKLGVPVEKLEQKDTPKGRYLVGTKRAEARPTLAVLPAALEELVRSIEFPKSMVWVPGSKLRFARPLRSMVALLDQEVVPFEWNGVRSGRLTRGHPFLAPGTIELRSAAWPDYERALRERRVVVSRDERRQKIRELVKQHLPQEPNPAVVATAANLVEWPEVMVGEFEAKFLEIPPGVIVAAIQGHLRAFPVTDAQGKLQNRFAFVANRPPNPTIRAGNERVLRARLSDAHFFFTKDQKTPLKDLVPRLKDVVFQRELGTYADKQARVEKLALLVAEKAGFAAAASIKEAASLMKADLLTEVVGEFPELQGEVGSVYARRQGHPAEVADAIREAYQPKGEGDALPKTRTGVALSIAEKLDNVLSAFATGMKPTGSKDPLGVRRQVLGVLRILREQEIHASLEDMIAAAAAGVPESAVTPKKKPDPKAPPVDLAAIRTKLAAEVRDYSRARLLAMASDEDFRPDLVNAVAAAGFDDVPDFWARLRALVELSASERFPAIVTLSERTRNITKGSKTGEPRADLLAEAAEKDLFAALEKARPRIREALGARRYVEAGRIYEQSLSAPVEKFMKDVFVNAPEEGLRANRHALLKAVYGLMAESFADLAEARA